MIQIDFRYRTYTYYGFFELPVSLASLLSYEAITISSFKDLLRYVNMCIVQEVPVLALLDFET